MQCGGGVNPIIIHSVTSLFNGYIQSLVDVNQAIVAWLFRPNTFTNNLVGQQRSLNLSVKIFVESIPNSGTDISGFNACYAFICKLFNLILKV